MRPPPILTGDCRLVRIEPTEIDLVAPDPDQEEPLEMPLILLVPPKDVVARPYRWLQRRDVDDEPGLLRDLANQSLFVGLAGLDSSSGRVPPRRTSGKVGPEKQQPAGAVDDQRTHCLANRWHRAR